MAIPALGTTAIGGSILGGGLSALGSIMSGNAGRDAANYRAAVARNYADYARQKGYAEAETQGIKTGKIIGQQRAAQGASGLDVNFGSNVDVRETTAQIGRLDELTIINNAMNKALGLETEAALDVMAGERARQEGLLGAGRSILGAATSVGDKWMSYRQRGVYA